MDRIKIGYFADGPWSHKAFNLLVADSGIEFGFLCPRYDSKDITLQCLAQKYKIPYIKSSNINSNEFIDQVKGFECDLFVSMSFNQIFRSRIINMPVLKTINCHAGKLPFYRGRNILNWALINDEAEFGITVHYVDEGIDTGDIILQRCFSITDTDNYKTLLERAYDGCAQILYDAVKVLQSGAASRVAQDSIHPVGFYCIQRMAGDEIINWNQSSRDIFNFVRAICDPGPMAHTFLGEELVKINRVHLIKNAPVYKGIPGAVVGVDAEGFVVKTADACVKVTEWDYLGKINIGHRLG